MDSNMITDRLGLGRDLPSEIPSGLDLRDIFVFDRQGEHG